MRLLPSAQSIAEDFSQSPRWYRLLIRCRFLLAGIYVLAMVGVVGWLLIEANPNANDLVGWTIVTAILFAGQAMLLAGAPQLRIARPLHRRHIAVSLISGGFVAGLLSFGFFATTVSLFGHDMNWTWHDSAGGNVFRNDFQWSLVFIGIPWLFWLLVFGLLWARRWTTGFGKMYRLLIAGTFAEVLFTVPVDVYVRRRTQCYCDEGTFAALIVGATAAAWTFGPGVVLLFLAVRIQRRQRRGVCRRCGYDLRGLPQPRCPECGTEFDKSELQNRSREQG